MHKLRVLLLSCLFVLLFAGNVFAEGFAVYEWGARSLALGGATVARTPDTSVISTNPAAMTYLEGTQVMFGMSAVAPVGEMVFANDAYPKEKLKDEVWPMPHFYFTHQLTDKITFGVGEFSRFGLGFTYDADWPGQANIYKVELQTASINPNIAFKATDNLSIGVGLEVMWLDILMKRNSTVAMHPVLGPITGNVRIKGDSYGIGGNIGLHYKFNDQWSAGFLYRTTVKHEVEGSVTINTAFGKERHSAHANITLPDSYAFAVAWQPREDLSIEVGAIRTNWSEFKSLDIYFSDKASMSEKNWKDSWRFNVGVEYQALDWLALRAGYVWDVCPVVNDYEDYLIPTENRKIYSLGAGFKFDAWTIDLGYGYLEAEERNYEGRAADGVVAGHTRRAHSHMGSISVGYKF